jgi:hypothetical protein
MFRACCGLLCGKLIFGVDILTNTELKCFFTRKGFYNLPDFFQKYEFNKNCHLHASLPVEPDVLGTFLFLADGSFQYTN